jgi:hypothetical protein
MLTPWTNQTKQATAFAAENLAGLVKLDESFQNNLRLFLPVF